eukprot:scaffold647824_cov44-Prasinocladus_malaysianus.AAC.1
MASVHSKAANANLSVRQSTVPSMSLILSTYKSCCQLCHNGDQQFSEGSIHIIKQRQHPVQQWQN